MARIERRERRPGGAFVSALDGWRTMEGRALDRVVAERLGWHMKPGGGVLFGKPFQTVYLVSPDGIETSLGEHAVVDPWKWALVSSEYADEDDHIGIPTIPAFSTDANAALSLPLDKGASLRLFSPDDDSPDEWEAVCCKGSSIERAFAPTPALAICRAWLAYQDSKSQAST